jgi:flagellar biosynthesis/type III secretory pathway protein FliH
VKFFAMCLGSLLFLAAMPGRAQSPDATSTPAKSAKPADPQGGTSPEKKKPKKVWTNDEISSVKGTVSVVGDGNSSSEKSGHKTSGISSGAEEARKKQIENYRNQIRQYNAQIEKIDKRIAQLKNFKAENTTSTGGINPTQGYNMVPLEEQVKELEENKKQLEAKIEDTENEARKNGIESGDLR